MFDGLIEFEAVARRASFTLAADELGLDATVLSRRIKRLEARLGVRLLQRTTRRVGLTEAGADYLRDVSDILARAVEAEAMLSSRAARPVGRLRLAVPNLFGQRQIAPLLPAFLSMHPDLALDVVFSDQLVNLQAERIDCAIRIGAQDAGGDVVARRLAPNRRLLCASPAYLKRAGRPGAPEELGRHRLLHFRPLLSGATWRLTSDGQERDVAVDPVLSADNAEALRLAAVEGTGIALLATFVVGDDLKAGRLVAAMPLWRPRESVISAIYPNAPHTPLKVRAFIDFIADRLKGEPPWDRGVDLD